MVTRRARSQHRPARDERGAAVFVVVMAITILTAVGIFAAHSATLVDEAAGYNRLARQTQQLAEYGTVAAATELSSGGAPVYIAQMQIRDPLKICVANAGVDADCYRLFYAMLNDRTKLLSNESLSKDPTGTVEDVIARGDVRGDFVVELTDPGPSGTLLPGSDPSKSSYIQVVATTIAQVRPVGVSACSDSSATESGTGKASVTGVQMMRAHLLVGPL